VQKCVRTVVIRYFSYILTVRNLRALTQFNVCCRAGNHEGMIGHFFQDLEVSMTARAGNVIKSTIVSFWLIPGCLADAIIRKLLFPGSNDTLSRLCAKIHQRSD
jgi:hypothetical protein